MSKAVTATYASEDSLKKTIDDLIGVGIPQEQINVTRSDMQIKVITPKACEQEIRSLLKRHNPIRYNSSCKYCDYLTI